MLKNGFAFNRFRKVFSWIAHRSPVLSMVITSYGLFSFYLPSSLLFSPWLGSEGGALKIWPCEAIQNAFFFTSFSFVFSFKKNLIEADHGD